MSIDMNQFVQVFFDETDEGLAEMERLLLGLDVDHPEPEDLNAIFRAAHSIKGGASTFGLTNIAGFTHTFESVLDRVRQGKIVLTIQVMDAFLDAKDVLKMLLDGHRNGGTVEEDAVASSQAALKAISETASNDVVAAPEPKPEKKSRQRQFHIEIASLSDDNAKLIEQELASMGAVTRGASAGNKAVFLLTSEVDESEIRDICAFIVDEGDVAVSMENAGEEDLGYGFFDESFLTNRAAEAVPAAPAAVQQDAPSRDEVQKHDDQHDDHAEKRVTKVSASAQEASSIRVGVEKVDQLINLVGELVITQAMIEQRAGVLDSMVHERLLSSIHQLQRNTRDLQASVMSIRMMPMDYVFSRFPRVVRDTSSKMGKKIQLVTRGAATELDKGLIERIVDPLTHLVRNSLDHGVEMPDVRLAAGKPETGSLTLSAEHRGGNIIIEVIDDGGGLNREKILSKARERGMDVSDSMQDSEVWQLIFEPGFSTADKVTDVSGRGVGMDVVKRNILAMGGVVDIRSFHGIGTTITISLPLTLAILDGMLIRIGEEVYILPLGYVIESLRPKNEDIHEVSGHGKVLKVRGEYLPLIWLADIFGVETKVTDPSDGLIVILESDGKKAALFVDDLIGQQQIVVKNLESNYRKVVGISGATILGDGGVALIVDVAALLRSSKPVHEATIAVT